MANSQTLRRGDMTQGSIYRSILLFALPTFLTTLLNQFYNMADSIIVGQFVGAEALAAVGANNVTGMLMVSLFQGAGIGGGIYIAQLFGARRTEDISKAFNTMYVLAALLALGISAVFLVFGRTIMHLMNTPENIFDDALLYFYIVTACQPGMAIYLSGSSALRSIGDTTAPLLFLIFTAILNVGLNVLFVLGLHMGVAGVAWATFISQYLSAVLVLWRTGRSKYSPITINLKSLRLDPQMAKIILRLGIPSALQMAVSSLGNLLVQRYTNLFGSAAVAASTTIHRLDAFVGMPCNALGGALSVFFGQNMAARRTERLHKATLFGSSLCTALTVAMSIVLYVFADDACRLFTQDAEIIHLGGQMFRMLCFFYWSMALNIVFTSIMRGAGDTKAVMVFSMIAAVIRVPLTWVLAIRPEPMIFRNIFLAMGLCNVLNLGMSLAYYLTGNWKKKVVVTVDE
ncbi:MAG: MATE family efflux transporter [Oscillospiraceae bacterium]|nr:MATE family efflux transporter [Oscillospiraceae bacterium]